MQYIAIATTITALIVIGLAVWQVRTSRSPNIVNGAVILFIVGVCVFSVSALGLWFGLFLGF